LEINNSDNHFVAELIKETGVVVVPGTGFGQVPGTKHFRVVFLPQDEVLEKAYKNIASFYEKYVDQYENVVK
jgi:alanine-synthesizing transaminase